MLLIKYQKILGTTIKVFSFLEIYKKKSFISQSTDAEKFISMTNNLKPEIIIIDDYRLNKVWHDKLKRKDNKIIVIDDLSNKKMKCDYYINYKLNLEKHYNRIKKINNNRTKLLLGINYCLIGKDLKRKHTTKLKKNIIINFGNSFNFNKIKKNLKKLFKLNHNIYVCVGIFAKNYKNIIDEIKKNKNIKIIKNQIIIDAITSKMDLFIGSSGNAIYENSYLKLPSIFSLTNNQNNNDNEFKMLGHQFYT